MPVIRARRLVIFKLDFSRHGYFVGSVAHITRICLTLSDAKIKWWTR
jgi:hypothetical protein